MSIEKNIERIAVSLERLCVQLALAIDTPVETHVDMAAGADKTVETVVTPPSAVEEQVTPPPPPPADTWVAKTAEELNDLVMIEYHRLGNQDGIKSVMAEFAVTSLSELPVTQQEALLRKVQALV